MGPKLIAEEGLLKGTILSLNGAGPWVIGRDETECSIVLTDPAVSRKHAKISAKEQGGYDIENLSLINPILVDRKPVTGLTHLHDGSLIQIGSTYFRYTRTFDDAFEADDAPEETIFEDKHPNPTMVDLAFPSTRWLLKVLAGPNTGAELYLESDKNYVVGKDPSHADIILHDRSVSNQHARLKINEEGLIEITDLDSKNGVRVGSKTISGEMITQPGETISLGTSTFVLIDTKGESSTIVHEVPKVAEEEEEIAAPERNLTKLFVPTSDLVAGGIFAVILAGVIFAAVLLFKSGTVAEPQIAYSSKIAKALEPFHNVEYSYDSRGHKLFIAGHVTSAIDKEQMNFNLDQLTFIRGTEDNVVVDELVWQEMNDILSKNPDWRSVAITAPNPGQFLVTGYLKTIQQANALNDYLNLNFPLVDRLTSRVVIDEVVQGQIAKNLLENGFGSVQSTFVDGELTLKGSVPEKAKANYNAFLAKAKELHGIRAINDGVIIAQQSSSAIDLSSKYRISGMAARGGREVNVAINGKIYFRGDSVDGMIVTQITPKRVLLEKDGLKYQISYTHM